jgi:putative phosphoribosyl transferase
MLFRDRLDAGRQLAEKLVKYKNSREALLLALPRGGVVIAKPISQILKIPIDIVVPRKIGAPLNEELALGAICEEEAVLNQTLIDELRVSSDYLTRIIDEEKKEALRRGLVFRKNKKPLQIAGKIIILLDDGIATGATMEVSIRYLKKHKPRKVIVAVPVLPFHQIEYFKAIADELYYLYAPVTFTAIGQFYENFDQVSDQEVLSILQSQPF